jgi:hypothetical protein
MLDVLICYCMYIVRSSYAMVSCLVSTIERFVFASEKRETRLVSLFDIP